MVGPDLIERVVDTVYTQGSRLLNEFADWLTDKCTDLLVTSKSGEKPIHETSRRHFMFGRIRHHEKTLFSTKRERSLKQNVACDTYREL